MTYQPVNRVGPYFDAMENRTSPRAPQSPSLLPPYDSKGREERSSGQPVDFVRQARDSGNFLDFRHAVESLAQTGGMQAARSLGGLINHAINAGFDPENSTYILCNLLLNVAGKPGYFQPEIKPSVELNSEDRRKVVKFVHEVAEGDSFNEEISLGARRAIFERYIRGQVAVAAVNLCIGAVSMLAETPPESILNSLVEFPWRIKSSLGFGPKQFNRSLPAIIDRFSRGKAED